MYGCVYYYLVITYARILHNIYYNLWEREMYVGSSYLYELNDMHNF